MATLGVLILLGAYLGVMRLVIDVSFVGGRYTPSDRDTTYLALHMGLLAASAGAGFAIGKWLNGLGAGYALLFVLALSLGMLLAQLGSYSLACQGHNDLIRHWTC